MRSIVDKLFKLNHNSFKTMDLGKEECNIFPYGDRQKHMVYELLYNIYPEKNQDIIRSVYLTIKKLRITDRNLCYREALSKVSIHRIKKYGYTLDNAIEKLMDYDLKVDEKLVYPTVNELMRLQ